MSSLEPENQDNIDRTNGNGSNSAPGDSASRIEQNGRRVDNNESLKPNDLKSICYRLLQKIDRSKDSGRDRRLVDHDSQEDSFIDDRSLAAQQFVDREKKGTSPGDNSGNGVFSKVSFDHAEREPNKEVENESPVLDLGSPDAPLPVSMESFFEFNFEISESLDDMVAEFELKNNKHQWNEWGTDESKFGVSDFAFHEGDSNGERHPNPVRAKFPK